MSYSLGDQMAGVTQNDSAVFPLRAAYPFLQQNDHSSEMEAIHDSKEKFGSYTSTLRRARIVALLQQHNLLEKFIHESWPYGATPDRKREVARLSRIFARYENRDNQANVEESEEEPSYPATAFAYEEHLRDCLAEHLDILERGLKLWPVGEDEDAVEFPVNGRRIDILAQDGTRTPVVIELKVSRGHEKTVGQALYYRARIKAILKVDKVRIFIVAMRASDELQLSSKEISDLTLFEYALSMTVKRV